jgi:hypothetical protein
MMTDTITDEEIDRLLQEAEVRLREKAGQVAVPVNENEIALNTMEAKPTSRKPLPRLQHGLEQAGYISEHNGIAQANPQSLIGSTQKQLADGLRTVGEPVKSKKANDQTTAGPAWFDLPKTDLTPQLKRDLQLIEMRSVLDPHRHYKKNNRKGKIPNFSQTGTVIEGPTEFFSSRINKKDRAKNFVEEAMVTEQQTGRFKRKYGEIQEAKTSGKKGHYKKLMGRRKRP